MHDTDTVLIPVRTAEQADLVDCLAREIWEEAFPSLISQEQIRYMLGKFQSSAAIREQITSGGYYYLLEVEKQAAGYFAFKPAMEESSLFLSKMYLLPAFRGQGFPEMILGFVRNIAWCYRVRKIHLTVNKQNHRAIRCYQKNGFRTTESLVTDIGKGFVMDDYRMENEF